MKIRVTFKDPDGVSNSLDEAVADSIAGISDEDEREAIKEIRSNKIADSLLRWIQYAEYLTVEFDTDAGTAIVLPAPK